MRLRVFLIIPLLLLVSSGVAFAKPIKIVLFGDSSLIGTGAVYFARPSVGIPAAETLTPRLEQALRARGWDIAIVNMSVPGRTANVGLQVVNHIPANTDLTIIRLGGRDLVLGARPEEVAASLGGIIDALHSRGGLVIITKYWANWPSAEPTLTNAGSKADALVDWWNGFFIAPATARPEYDAGDGMHLNAAANAVIVSRAVPDIERVLVARGFRPGA